MNMLVYIKYKKVYGIHGQFINIQHFSPSSDLTLFLTMIFVTLYLLANFCNAYKLYKGLGEVFAFGSKL